MGIIVVVVYKAHSFPRNYGTSSNKFLRTKPDFIFSEQYLLVLEQATQNSVIFSTQISSSTKNLYFNFGKTSVQTQGKIRKGLK